MTDIITGRVSRNRLTRPAAAKQLAEPHGEDGEDGGVGDDLNELLHHIDTLSDTRIQFGASVHRTVLGCCSLRIAVTIPRQPLLCLALLAGFRDDLLMCP